MWLPSSGICLLVPNPSGWGFADIVCLMLQISGSFFPGQWIVQLDLLPHWKGALLVSTCTGGASINYLADTYGSGYLQNWSALGNWQNQQWSGWKSPHSKYWSSKLIFLIAQKSQTMITPLRYDVLHHRKLWISVYWCGQMGILFKDSGKAWGDSVNKMLKSRHTEHFDNKVLCCCITYTLIYFQARQQCQTLCELCALTEWISKLL